MAPPQFRLRKWYVDCVTPDGALFIGYLARVELGPLRFWYGATIEQDAPGSPILQRQTLRRGEASETGGCLRFALPGLFARGEWVGGSGTGPQLLHQEPRGTITWEGLLLNARATVTSGARRYDGAGYAEVVTLTLPPWRLPFDSLRWGRFISDDLTSALTWIDASGRLELGLIARLVAQPGEGLGEGSVVVESPGAGVRDLAFAETRSIRREVVTRTLLGRLHGLAALLPRGIRQIEENKYLSRGTLGEREGWVVHEEVQWRRRSG